MSGNTYHYVQCWLQRGTSRQMAWIPEKYAVVGRFLRLTEDGVSENGWEVVGAGARQPVEYVRERSQDYKNTRRASDI